MANYELPIIRILSGIRCMGYTPVSAFQDIIDNSIAAEASEVEIIIETSEKSIRPDINKVIFIDNGKGMNLEMIRNALLLGSPDSSYAENSLSKFGFGLKSAGLSQANIITVVSRNNMSDEWEKCTLDWDVIREKNAYYIEEDETLTIEEASLTEKLIGTGTIVILDKIQKVNDANSTIIIKNLKTECSLTYHRMLERKSVSIKVNGESIEPYDPLFLSEASKCSVKDYNGKNPAIFFNDEVELPVNPETNTTMKVKAVQLPNPPLFKAEGRQKEVNKKYRMLLKNIGFYIYRNDRLIARAETLDLLPREQDYISFRASIDLNSDSDEDVNLNVLKTKVLFPDYAYSSLEEVMRPVVRSSKEIWNSMKSKTEYVVPNSEKKHERSNVMLDEVTPILVNDEKGEIENMEQILEQNAEELKRVYNNRDNLISALRESSNRIVIVEQLENDMLWKPGIGGKNGSDVVVYISRSHPFYQYIYKDLEAGEDTLVILDALFLNLSMAEASINATDRLLVKVFDKLRSSASLQLSRFIEVRLDDSEYD